MINATYFAPLTFWLYFRYGRPTKPEGGSKPACHSNARGKDESGKGQQGKLESGSPSDGDDASQADPTRGSRCHRTDLSSGLDAEARAQHSSDASAAEKGQQGNPDDAAKADDSGDHCHHGSSRPMYATVLAGVSHCGAGCVLGDVVGEWVVYGSGATINGESIWLELLVDYAFALLVGIAFQYFSIAPMRGKYGPKVVWDAAKADILSLTSFEVGAFGWMIIYQVAIFTYRLEITTYTYWFMMQVGMCLGFATAAPMNWWLIGKGIKEPCC